ncbi:MAG: hypothetical protein ACRDZX_18755, partial [Acidimicrobiales bacterium]
PGLVDVARLKEQWLALWPPAPSSALLQAAWLAQAGLGPVPPPSAGAGGAAAPPASPGPPGRGA